MAKLLKLRRGTTSQHSSFTGAEGEVTVDTTKDTLVVHDGSTQGGIPLAKESTVLSLIDEDNMSTDSASRPPSQQSVKAYTDTTFAPKASPALTGTATGVNLTLSGDLIVNGTTTTINSTTLSVDDKNIELGSVASPSDTTADGGGITLKGASDKTFNWVDATDAWTSSEHIHVPDDKKLIVGTGSDLNIYHAAGAASHINATGLLNIDGTTGVRLEYNNATKLETTTAGVTVTGSVTDDKGNVRSIPQNTQGSAYTIVAADAGKHILASGTITIPDSVFSAGDAVTIVNNTSGDLTITKTITTMYLGTDATSANRTLATRGIATILFASGTVAYISGAGLS